MSLCSEMSKLFQFLLCCCVVGFAFGGAEADIKSYLTKLAVQCSNDFAVTSDEMMMMQKHKLPDSENARCLMACVYRKATWIDDKGMFDSATALEMAKKEHGDNTALTDNTVKLFDICKSVNDKTVKDGEKGCDRAALLFECFTENAPKLGFKM